MNALFFNASFLARKLETALVGEASGFRVVSEGSSLCLFRNKAGRFAYRKTGSPYKV